MTAASGLGVGDTLGESEGGAAVGGPVGETVPAASPATLSTTTPTLSPRCESQENAHLKAGLIHGTRTCTQRSTGIWDALS